MKREYKILSVIVFLAAIFTFTACEDKVEQVRVYKVNVAKYMSKEDLRKSVKVTSPRSLVNPGKIYFYKNYLLINEKDEGIHVYDNTNPANPMNVSFIEIPANRDMAIKDNRLFADSYIDLVVFDVTNMSNVTEINRIQNVFENNYPQPDWTYPCDWGENQEGVLIGWDVEERTEEIEYSQPPEYLTGGAFGWRDDADFDMVYMNSKDMNGAAEAAQSTTGTGGSMARFRIYQNYLYIAKSWEIKIIDITNLNDPIEAGMFYPNLTAETVFIAKDKLFIGATTGMAIYDLKNPVNPEFLSLFAHVNSCDPVVVDEKYAYVTLRSGNECQSFTNQLDVLNIEDLRNPIHLKTYPMHNPHGLGVDENLLFICDGDDGLKIYDKTDVYNIDNNMVTRYKNIHAYDVIPMKGTLMMIGNDGFYQYDYSNLNDVKFLSKIEVSKN